MKTAIVTGAGGNLGRVVVKKFLEKGFYVKGTITPRDQPEIIKHVNFESVVADLMDEQVTLRMVEDLARKQGNIDAAVLTAGGFAMGKIAETRSADVERLIKLNFETTYNVARPVFMQMVKQGRGRIFLVGARPGLDMHQSKGMVAYGMSKSLVFHLAELMNDEGKAHDVVTSVLVPSTIDTAQNRESMPDADFSKWVKAETIADTILYYCSDEASAIREPVIKLYNKS